jgi:hypothetical protein
MSDQPIHVPGLMRENSSGIFAAHPVRSSFPHAVATTGESRAAAFNEIRKPLVPIACAGLADTNFAFDSSFLDYGTEFWFAEQGFTALASLLEEHPGSRLSIFGHSDPVGTDPYNKWLSERRAKSIYAVLIREPQLWEELYDPTKRGLATGDRWDLRVVQCMLDVLGYEPGRIDGVEDAQTRAAIKRFEETPHQLRPPADGGEPEVLPPRRSSAGANTRAMRLRLYRAYMDRVCHYEDGTEFRLQRSDFLGSGAQAGAFQGCGRFNPQLLQTRADVERWRKAGKAGDAERNDSNEPNRRVLIFVFPDDATIDTSKWPCPAAAKGIRKCVDRFWSNGEQRRSTLFENHQRRFGARVPAEAAELVPADPDLAAEMAQDETTFACRFYHGLAVASPCERDLRMYVVQLQMDGLTEESERHSELVPVSRRRFVMKIGGDAPDATALRGRTTLEGVIAIPLLEGEADIEVHIDAYRSPYWDHDTEDSDPTGDADADAFPDETLFVRIPLAAGKLRRLTGRSPDDPGFDTDEPGPGREEVIEATKQRLYNLGYGADGWPWSEDQFKRYLAVFQHEHDLEEEARRGRRIGPSTIAMLKELHEPR